MPLSFSDRSPVVTSGNVELHQVFVKVVFALKPTNLHVFTTTVCAVVEIRRRTAAYGC